MDINPKDFYTYFKECYKLDYKEFSVDNLLSQKYKYKWFVREKEDLLQAHSPLVYYDNIKMRDLEYELDLYRLEKQLFYASFLVLGRNENHLSKDKRYCAPLLLNPASIETINGDKFLKVDRKNFTINPSVLSKLNLVDDSKTKDLFIDELNDFLAADYPDFIHIKSLIDEYFTNIDTEDLLLFPKVWSITEVRKYLSNSKLDTGNFKIVPAAGTCLIKKSNSSLHVINDLTQIAEQGAFNSSLNQLLSGIAPVNHYETSFFSSRLNTGQYDALKNAHTYNNSVIVGPPGTGKTYTISSIVADAVVKNQSVLVVSKSKRAVEVIRHMLQDDFKLKDYIFHTTGHHHKISLKAKVKRYLSGMNVGRKSRLDDDFIRSSFHQLTRLEQRFEHAVEKEMELSRIRFSDVKSLSDKWKLFLHNYVSFENKEIWEIFKRLEDHLEYFEGLANRYSKEKIRENIRVNFYRYRSDIAKFYEALEAYNFSEYKRIIEEVSYSNIIKVFPIWLANSTDLNTILPAQKNLFDLVIIDEATQCDIATALPALYRAKRAVIVGDPNQLRHYSFVSRAQQNNLRIRYNIPKERIYNYRDQSVLDLFISKVADQNQVSFLREHFRSTPSIIEFSNKYFYDGQLQIIKSTPKHTYQGQIELIDLKGSRDQKGVNEVEAKRVITILQQLIEDYKDELKKPSIGIISPFNSQVNHIKELLRDHFELSALKKHEVLCGTPYHFQGSEREIVILSFAVCDNSHASAIRHAATPEVLNVAITRARSFQYVLKSISVRNLKEDSLLGSYLRFIQDFSHEGDDNEIHDHFQKEVVDSLKERGYTDVKCGYPIAGSILDILVYHNNHYYFIDLIGYPGEFEEAFSLERYKTLARTGIKSFPLHFNLWQKDKEEITTRLTIFLE